MEKRKVRGTGRLSEDVSALVFGGGALHILERDQEEETTEGQEGRDVTGSSVGSEVESPVRELMDVLQRWDGGHQGEG